jgi:hypothetical protein
VGRRGQLLVSIGVGEGCGADADAVEEALLHVVEAVVHEPAQCVGVGTKEYEGHGRRGGDLQDGAVDRHRFRL